ncbi:putative disease resistance RPP13-like protein 1 isoform X2 [Hevea brasiliensis]|nr:putative disease resistance RPP13-like protein 1 isoform X2 [Hevea brasiliensis]
MLRKIYAVLDDAEEKQLTNQLVKIWVSELRDLAYDVEDVLDEFATEALRRRLVVKPLAITNKVKKSIPTCFGVNPRTVKFNSKLLSKMEEITARLEKITAGKHDLDLRESTGRRSNRVRERQPSTSLVNEAKVYGREDDLKALLVLLKTEVSGAEICVIPIIGMGGIGKTTLAQLIFNDATLDFDFKSWVSVGEHFDVIGITKTILQSEDGDAKDLDSLQVKLKENLSGKKFLVVLDDVWSENYDDWTLFCGPFVAGAPGSRIIVTTRNQGVSLMMGNVPAYPLKELSDDDCLAVFAQHALGAKNFDAHSKLEEIGKKIAKRCQGLPLAAKALGGLLRGKLDCNVWKEVLNSKIWDLPEEKNGILPALRLSYHHLPSHLKRCFAYCAVFPKDYKFDKKELVLLWMAEGFLRQPNEMKPIEDLGHEYFHDLLSRSFFQQSSNKDTQYVMHDLIRNLARSVNEEICFNLDDKLEGAKPNPKVRHSSFSRHVCDISKRFEVFNEMKSLRTFLALPVLPSYYHQLSSKVLHEFVPKLRCLTVLSLAGYCFDELPSSIGALKHLRYLNLSYSEITMLPESSSKLFNLQTLKLCGCRKLTKLPTGISNLINLMHLDISDTDSLQEMPPHMGNLTNLHSFSKFIVGEGHGRGIMELMKLSHLRGELRITGLHNVANVRDSELVNLKEKQNIDALALEWIGNFHGVRNLRDELQVLNSLQPHQNLHKLSVKFYGGTIFPLWIGDPKFINMMHLELCNCQKITSLPPVGQLPLLKKLSILGMDGVKEVGIEFYGVRSSSAKAFPSLETLTIKNMVEWEQWSSEELQQIFINLRELRMRNCPKLVGKLPRFLPSLENLDICDCPQLVELPEILPSLRKLKVEKCQEMFLRSARDLVSLTTLKIKRISGLVSLHEVLVQALIALEDLEIVGCHELMYLWPDGSNVNKFASMRRLDIQHCKQLVSLVGGGEGFLPCNLEVLSIQKCGHLNKLPDGLHSLTSLRFLRISSCPKLVSFPTTGLPNSLRQLMIMDCNSLVSLPEGIICNGNDANEMSYLQNLAIEGCSSRMSFPIGKFPDSFRTLTICFCTKQLLELQSDRLLHLTYLEIKDCHELECFPEVGLPIPTLIYFTISRCENLKCLPSQMQNLASLQYLEIYDCGGMLSFPEGGFPPNLTTLRIRDCKNLRQPMYEWGLHRLTYLRRLSIKGTSPSTDIASFPDNGLLLPTSLTLLWIDGLKNLKSISKGLQSLTSLENLWIWNCPKLRSLPKEGLPATLGFLEILSCPLLKQRCLNGKGDYWPIIAPIPCVIIDSKLSEMPLNPWFMPHYLVQTWGHA